MKIIISEEQMMSLRLRRRGVELEKIGDIIEYQTEIQDPCNFEDASEYADFCIGQGVSFYYCDEDYCDEDDEDGLLLPFFETKRLGLLRTCFPGVELREESAEGDSRDIKSSYPYFITTNFYSFAIGFYRNWTYCLCSFACRIAAYVYAIKAFVTFKV